MEMRWTDRLNRGFSLARVPVGRGARLGPPRTSVVGTCARLRLDAGPSPVIEECKTALWGKPKPGD